jgi:alkanesulfonate monooxygenase SsuD/methylene tetrahydromethanopterin reductase-like flavin-dependent oxidoreductase (luciferase family)
MAATTSRIKVGTAGVLMNYYRPYKVARTFQVLENLFGGRIDLGICRGGLAAEVGPELREAESGSPTMEEFAARAESLFNYLARGAVDGSGNGLPQAWVLGSGSASMRLATKLESSYCHSLTHKGSSRDPAILATYHHARAVDSACQSAVLVGGICAPSAREADELLSRYHNPSLEPNVVGTPGTCADQLHSIAHQYQVERIVWLDLSATRVELQRSITLLADAMALND